MKLDDVQISGKPLVLARPAEVDALEAALWVTFPDGYREYVTRLGEGVLGKGLVRVYPPWRIAREIEPWRRRIAKYWFWDKSGSVLPKARALECVIVGDTTNGDEIIFHPTRAGRIFILPRNRATARVVEGGLWAAVKLMCSSGRSFEPFDSRKEAKKEKTEAIDPEGESLDALMVAAREWAKRHGARKQAQRDLRAELKDADITGLTARLGTAQKMTLLQEAVVLEDSRPFNEVGYSLAFRVNDAKTGVEIGTFTWSTEGESPTTTYAQHQPNVAKLKKKSSS